jgi:PAS domain S-box-containing protein
MCADTAQTMPPTPATPDNDTAALRFEELFDLAEIQRIQDAFAAATGVASIITDPQGRPLTRPSNFCRLCSEIIRKTPQGLANCMRSDAVLGALNPEGPIIQPCLSGGLWDGGTSICVGDHHIANWLIGQVLDEQCDEAKMVAYARAIGADETAFRTALAEVTRMPHEQFVKICNALRLIANQLSRMALLNAQQAHDLADRRQHEALLQEKEQRLALALAGADLGTWDWNLQTNALIVDQRYATMLGRTPEEFKGVLAMAEQWTHADDVPRLKEEINRNLTGAVPFYECEFRMLHRDGHWVWILGRGKLLAWDAHGAPLRMVGTHLDITARKLLEDQRLDMERSLLHAQKLESLGVLAGGIAHDFNNLLMAILGNLDLARADLPAGLPACVRVQDAETAARRAADLTRQMLAYAGRGQYLITPVNISTLIEQMVNLLRSSVTKTAQITLQLDPALPPISADATQIEQIIMNLLVNASEAMTNRPGEIVVSTRVVTLDAAQLAHSRVQERPPAGKFICLQVTDSGCGMDSATLQRLFDPFFTTKFTGRGLGMAAVLGIVRAHHGAIFVTSAPEQGTTVQVMFPLAAAHERAAGAAGCATLQSRRAMLWRSPVPRTVLVVDDEDMVRSVCADMLRTLGCTPLLAADGDEAMRVYAAHRQDIHCVLLDLAMPKRDGIQVLRELQAVDPSVAVLFSSGYTYQDAVTRFTGLGVAGFIQKPYDLHTLAHELQRVLER